MRADPASYELVAPGNLSGVLSLLAERPGEWMPIAGGTDVMVLYSAGKLSARKLVSLWNLPELRRIEVSERELAIGAGCTYTDLREHSVVQPEFPLLASAASWTGGIANQNRGTLGGNIVNASPAADSLPALLVYEAELILVSARGKRRVPYVDFHTGYKKTLLAPDELIRAICLPRRYAGYISYSRKVGARNAQAISKVCVAALAKMADQRVEEVRIAAGSVAPTPMRLRKTEEFIAGKTVDAVVVDQAGEMARQEINPIDDIRSTAAYRSAVVGNLVAEFLNSLTQAGRTDVLSQWNQIDADAAAAEVLPCCGSRSWARSLAERRPLTNASSLIAVSDEIWNQLGPQDWLEAFSKHPRIGERKTPDAASAQSAAWSAQEQKDAAAADEAVKFALVEGNREYEKRFGRVFIVCATGKSAGEILDILRQRLHNDDATELRIAADEQRKITNLRLKKWLCEEMVELKKRRES
jgi:OHCU decarboxylase